MAKIEVNFDTTPDEVLPLEPGVYVFKVVEADIELVKDNAEKKKLVVVLEVDDEGNPSHGRRVYDHIGLSNQFGQVSAKRLAKSCGITLGPGGIDTSDLIGKNCKARVAARTYQDKTTGETKEATGIKEYMF